MMPARLGGASEWTLPSAVAARIVRHQLPHPSLHSVLPIAPSPKSCAVSSSCRGHLADTATLETIKLEHSPFPSSISSRPASFSAFRPARRFRGARTLFSTNFRGCLTAAFCYPPLAFTLYSSHGSRRLCAPTVLHSFFNSSSRLHRVLWVTGRAEFV